ncbi:MAG: NAD(P)-binding protein [Byssovorax sp.]
MLLQRKSTLESPEHLVVGAGISGLWAALLLARKGRRVRVIDDREARSAEDGETFRGLPTDLVLHCVSPSTLEQPLFQEIHKGSPFSFCSHRGVLLFADRQMSYPPDPLAMMKALGPVAGLSLSAGLFARNARRQALGMLRGPAGKAPMEGDPGFEGAMIDRVGERAYQAFYRPYVEKVWGIPPEELSQSLVYRRVHGDRPRRADAHLADRAVDWVDAGLRDHGSLGFLFPAGGASSILAWLEAKLAELRVPIDRGRAFGRADVGTTPVLYAGDLDALVESGLTHRGAYLVWLALPLDRDGRAQTYHSSDPRHWFGRVTELTHAAPEVRPGEALFCVEIPEGRWGAHADFTRGERLSVLLEQLATAGIVPHGVFPIEAVQRFVPRVYPLYRRGWIDEWRRAMQKVIALRAVIPIGPEALFQKAGLDQATRLAEAAVHHVEARLSIETWIAQAEGS